MDVDARINAALETALGSASGGACPPRLAEAMNYAVFPGGHRIRPRLCLAVAMAHGDADDGITDAALCSIELLHCASLVHDDMPCFDAAELRRGKPSVHVAYGEALALLVGDALIVHAFQVLSSIALRAPRRTGTLLGIVAAGVGAPGGIVGGQAWECESARNLRQYQQGKTGSLFAAATMAGAAAAGHAHEQWYALGNAMGEAYQVADDLLDRFGTAEVVGKSVGRDAKLDRSNAVSELGVDAATRRLESIISDMLDAIPACPGRDGLRTLIRAESSRFTDLALRARRAA